MVTNLRLKTIDHVVNNHQQTNRANPKSNFLHQNAWNRVFRMYSVGRE